MLKKYKELQLNNQKNCREQILASQIATIFYTLQTNFISFPEF